jgi:hypothetical protein
MWKATDLEDRHFAHKVKRAMSACGFCCGRGVTAVHDCILRLIVMLVATFDGGDGGPYCGPILWRRSSHRYAMLVGSGFGI